MEPFINTLALTIFDDVEQKVLRVPAGNIMFFDPTSYKRDSRTSLFITLIDGKFVKHVVGRYFFDYLEKVNK